MNSKDGNVIVTLGIVIMVLIFLAFFFIYYQVNTVISGIKSDLFYVTNNVILAMNKEELAFSKYEINNVKAKTIIESLLRKNHVKNNGYVKDIEIDEFEYNKDNQIAHLSIKVKFKPLIKVGNKEIYEFILKEDTKVSLLQYN